MPKQRKHDSAELEAKVDLEAIKGQQTANEIASRYGLHPNLVTNWKKLALEQLRDLFSDRRSRAARFDEELN